METADQVVVVTDVGTPPKPPTPTTETTTSGPTLSNPHPTDSSLTELTPRFTATDGYLLAITSMKQRVLDAETPSVVVVSDSEILLVPPNKHNHVLDTGDTAILATHKSDDAPASHEDLNHSSIVLLKASAAIGRSLEDSVLALNVDAPAATVPPLSLEPVAGPPSAKEIGAPTTTDSATGTMPLERLRQEKPTAPHPVPSLPRFKKISRQRVLPIQLRGNIQEPSVQQVPYRALKTDGTYLSYDQLTAKQRKAAPGAFSVVPNADGTKGAATTTETGQRRRESTSSQKRGRMQNMQRSKSLNDLDSVLRMVEAISPKARPKGGFFPPDKVSGTTAFSQGPTSVPPNNLPMTTTTPSATATKEETREEAAVLIQRMYRFYRIRKHFSTIVDKVNTNQAAMSVGSILLRRPSLRKSSGSQVVKKSSVTQTLTTAPTTQVPNVPPPPSVQQAEKNTLAIAIPLRLPSSAFHAPPPTAVEPPNISPRLSQASPSSMSGIDEETSSLEVKPSTLMGKSSSLPGPTDRQIRRYINEFNVEPKHGMNNLIRIGAISGDPEAIAKFLMTNSRLSKTKIGEYLCIGDELQNKVLCAFVSLLDFTGLTFDEALRKLLKTFRLPGEAQKIDRAMNEFAIRFCTNNPNVMSSSDTAYILAYSLIMLNTDAHNPNVKKKMSLQDFLRNNRGIDNKKDLPEDFMKQLYFNIVRNEIKMNEHDSVFQVRSICAQITGMPQPPEAIAIPTRRFVAEFNVQQIPDLTKTNVHRHERTIFVFNDMMIVTKPRAGYYTATLGRSPVGSSIPVTSNLTNTSQSSYDTATTAGTSSASSPIGTLSTSPPPILTASTSTSTSASVPTAISPSHPETFQYRYTFNMVTLEILDYDKDETPYHNHVAELINDNGKLVTLAFPTAEERQRFHRVVGELVEDVALEEDEKRQKLQKLTEARVATTKEVIEQLYATTDKADAKIGRLTAEHGSLRQARLALQRTTTMMFGKNGKVPKMSAIVTSTGAGPASTPSAAQPSPATPAPRNPPADFKAKVRLEAPSPSPNQVAQSSMMELYEEEGDLRPHSVSGVADAAATEGSNPDVLGSAEGTPPRPTLSNRPRPSSRSRKRRNTLGQ